MWTQTGFKGFQCFAHCRGGPCLHLEWWFGGLVAKSCLTLAAPWTAAHQALLSMGFSRQGYWSGLPFHSPRDLPDPGIEPRSPASQADSLPTELFRVVPINTQRPPPALFVWNVCLVGESSAALGPPAELLSPALPLAAFP